MTHETPEKPCRDCGESLPANVEHFGRRSRTHDGLGSRCLECDRRRDFETHAKQTRLAIHAPRSNIRAGVPVRPLNQNAQRKIAFVYSNAPTAKCYRGVNGGPILFGYVRRAS